MTTKNLETKLFAVMPLGGNKAIFVKASSMVHSTDEHVVLTDETMNIVYSAPLSEISYCREVKEGDPDLQGKTLREVMDPDAARRMSSTEADQLYHEMLFAVFSGGDVPLEWLEDKRREERLREQSGQPQVEVVDVDIDWEAAWKRILGLRFAPAMRFGVLCASVLVILVWTHVRLITPNLYTRAAQELVQGVESLDDVNRWEKRWGRLLKDAIETGALIRTRKATDPLLVRDLRVIDKRIRRGDEDNVRWVTQWEPVVQVRDAVFRDAFLRVRTGPKVGE